ncbi:MAG TPA: SDR family NAD(P)-dependent oxidoreductase [Marmoricola sp.]|jgi:NAD(P)-dependent dehydrogenase (short-subunit alcohol dehydrogenase family)|nr:SDR family NAD(P)-dependent oxidoreductase [Marmoricola sp.]
MTHPIPFDAGSEAADVIAGIDLVGQRAIVTGGASGIGLETARALAGAGAAVTVAVRDTRAARSVVERLRAETGNAAIDTRRLDLADLDSVAAFAAGWTGPLHVLVNNAGVMALPGLTLTKEGRELQFATNHLGHAALMLGLRHALVEAGGARVVAVSSSAHLISPVRFDDMHFSGREYDAWSAYGQSKTATTLFAMAASDRWAADGIAVNSLHPGYIMTNLQRHLDEQALAFVGATDEHGARLEVPQGWKTPQQGAATSVLLAGSPLVADVTGQYFEDNQPAEITQEPAIGGTGLAYYAADRDLATQLWDETQSILGR